MVLDYLESCKKQFIYYKMLGEKSISMIDDQDLFWTPDEKSNSVAVLIQHLAGNMLSRWTDFLSSDGEKTWRNRDKEFELYLNDRNEAIKLWNEGWDCLFMALDEINEHNIDTTIYIRNKGHSIPEAINRQLCHYSYHIGQIVFTCRLRAKGWKSLSIPKGESKKYNKESFKLGKRKEHFSEEFVDKSKKSNF